MRWKPSSLALSTMYQSTLILRVKENMNLEHITREENTHIVSFLPKSHENFVVFRCEILSSIIFTRYKLIDICVTCHVNMGFIATDLACLRLLILPHLGQVPMNSRIHLWFYASIGTQVLSDLSYQVFIFQILRNLFAFH